MNNTRIVISLLAVLALSLAPSAYAVDNDTEFGIADDLTVLGTGGTVIDPDLEVKGFSVFGATQSAPALYIPAAPGNIFANGYVQVSSGMYVAGSSTFTSGAYFTGISSFAAGPGSIYVNGGTPNQVLKKVAGGGMTWADDLSGAGAISGTPNRIQKIGAGGAGLVDSVFLQSGDGDTASITMLGSSLTVNSVATFKSSVTILGNGTDGLGVTGATKLTGALTVVGAVATSLGGTLGVTGAATLSDNLTVNGNARLGDALTDFHGINKAGETGVALAVDSVGTTGNYAAKFYSGGSLAAWIKKK